MHTRTDVLNLLIKENRYTSYLEIGCGHHDNCRHISIPAVTVDPNPALRATHHVTSDEYFASTNKKFDLIFVDGLHLHEQALRDIKSALLHLNEGGSVVVHDTSPKFEQYQLRTQDKRFPWCGDVWKAIMDLRQDPLLKIETLDIDYGVSIICTGTQQPLKEIEYSYPFLERNRANVLNVVSVESFISDLRSGTAGRGQ